MKKNIFEAYCYITDGETQPKAVRFTVEELVHHNCPLHSIYSCLVTVKSNKKLLSEKPGFKYDEWINTVPLITLE